MRQTLRLACACLLASGLDLAAQEFTTLKGHGGPIMDIDIAGDGRVATASFDNSLGLWQGRLPTWLDGHDAAVTVLRVLPDGRVVSGGDDFSVRLWDGTTSRVLGRHHGKVSSLAVHPDGAKVISGSWDGTIREWPLDGGEGAEMARPGGGVNAVVFGPDGALHAATSNGVLWRYRDRQQPEPLVRHGFGINEVIVTADWIAYGAVDGGTRILAPDGSPLRDFTLDRRPILALDYHAGTGQLAVGDGLGYIMIVDTRDWRIARDFRATRRGPVWALAFSPDGGTLYAGGLDDVVYGWPVALLDEFEPQMGQQRSFLRDASSMPNGERQFMRKCSICHALEDGPSRKAGPTLHGVFGRRAGTVPGYSYSQILTGSDIVWGDDTIDALFDLGPDHYIPGSKMPMQVIARPKDRSDLIAFLKQATQQE